MISDLHDIGKEGGLGDGEEVEELDHLGVVPAGRGVLRHPERYVRPSVNVENFFLTQLLVASERHKIIRHITV